MKKKSYKGSGVSLFPPELGEITQRLKDKEPELDEIVQRGSESQDSGPLDAADIVTIKEVIAWWRSRKDGSTVHEAPRYRPTFPGRRDNRGIRINRRLMEDTLRKAREQFSDATSTGKLSPTIEFLCWQFLGFDQKYLSRDDA